MPITISTDIVFKYSITSGTAGNQNPQTNPNNSLGGWMSQTTWTGGALHDLFDVLTGTENAALQSDYRCVFIANNNATITFTGVVFWITGVTAGGATIAIGVDPALASAEGATTQQATIISSDTTAPTGVVFSTPTTQAGGLAIGDLAPGQTRAIWIKRTAINGSPINADQFTLNFAGDTGA